MSYQCGYCRKFWRYIENRSGWRWIDEPAEFTFKTCPYCQSEREWNLYGGCSAIVVKEDRK